MSGVAGAAGSAGSAGASVLDAVAGLPATLAGSPQLAASIVDWGQLLEVVEAGLIAGVGISIAFSFVILGAVRAAEAQQQSRTVALIGYSALALFAVAVCIGAVVFGVSTMLTK